MSFSIYKPAVISETNSIWNFKDNLGALKVRFSIGRNGYSIHPGLFKSGNPDNNSEVFVTANYKLSFDVLRRSLKGLNAWILVLDTKGINVWCAAGKGTFGTEELINRIEKTNLSEIVKHRRIILPQLGAPGIAAFAVKTKTGFNIKYGPVRASNIKEYLEAGYKSSENMRQVRFNFIDRLILTPVEIMNNLWQFLAIVAGFIILSGLTPAGYSLDSVLLFGPETALFASVAFLSGTLLTPIFLPFLPTPYFAGKGILTGGLAFIILYLLGFFRPDIMAAIAWVLIISASSSFLAMNFTGASTYTSLSGVRKEMKLFIPIQITMASLGIIFLLISKLF